MSHFSLIVFACSYTHGALESQRRWRHSRTERTGTALLSSPEATLPWPRRWSHACSRSSPSWGRTSTCSPQRAWWGPPGSNGPRRPRRAREKLTPTGRGAGRRTRERTPWPTSSGPRSTRSCPLSTTKWWPVRRRVSLTRIGSSPGSLRSELETCFFRDYGSSSISEPPDGLLAVWSGSSIVLILFCLAGSLIYGHRMWIGNIYFIYICPQDRSVNGWKMEGYDSVSFLVYERMLL